MKKYLLFGLGLMALLFSLSLRSSPAQAAPPAQLTLFPTPTPGADGRILYIVQAGDTLWRISAITGITIDELRALNNLGADDLVTPGQILLIGMAGPVVVSPTPGPGSTPVIQPPTLTPLPGWGNLCILLFNDINGDALRQEEEPSLAGGAVSVGNRLGTVSLTADTLAGGFSDAWYPTPEELGYVCFLELPEGEYNITAAIPDGYNPTTTLSRAVKLSAGDETFLTFGAQANSETLAEVAIIPETPGRSPVLGILGALLLLGGLALGAYAFFLRRSVGFKGPEGR